MILVLLSHWLSVKKVVGRSAHRVLPSLAVTGDCLSTVPRQRSNCAAFSLPASLWKRCDQNAWRGNRCEQSLAQWVFHLCYSAICDCLCLSDCLIDFSECFSVTSLSRAPFVVRFYSYFVLMSRDWCQGDTRLGQGQVKLVNSTNWARGVSHWWQVAYVRCQMLLDNRFSGQSLLN